MEHNDHKAFAIGPYRSSGKKIGKGSFATVYLGHHQQAQQDIVAIKVVDVDRLSKSNQKLKKHLESEINITKSLQHPNIVCQHDVILGSEYIYMILEYCEGGDFSEFLRTHKRLSEDTARHFLRQLASGLQFLQSKNIVHRDLKPQNLLLSSRDPQQAVLKIADFGFARFIEPQSVANTLCGSPLYMAPEILMCQPYDATADLWSVGAILYEMLVGSPPFNVKTQIELVRMLVTTKVKFPKNLNVSPECLDLLQSLLKKNKDERISWSQFFDHPFLAGNPLTTLRPRAVIPSGPSTNALPKAMRHWDEEDAENKEPGSSGSSSYMSISPIIPSHHAVRAITRTPSGTNLVMQGIPAHTLPKNPHSNHNSPHPSSGQISPMALGRGNKHGPLSSPVSYYTSQPSEIRKPKTNPFKLTSDLHPGMLVHDLPSLPSVSSFSTDESSVSSAELSFEMIESGSSSTFSSAHLSAEERHIIDGIELHLKRAQAVVEIGDLKVSTNNPVEALALYIKALHTFQDALHFSKQIMQAAEFATSPRLGLVVEKLKEDFASCLSKAEYWKRNLRPSDTSVCAEKSIYDFSLLMGREAAVAEVLKNFAKAEVLYSKASLLLQQLWVDATHPSDKAVLRAYLDAFRKRIRDVKNKRDKVEDESAATSTNSSDANDRGRGRGTVVLASPTPASFAY